MRLLAGTMAIECEDYWAGGEVGVELSLDVAVLEFYTF